MHPTAQVNQYYLQVAGLRVGLLKPARRGPLITVKEFFYALQNDHTLQFLRLCFRFHPLLLLGCSQSHSSKNV